MPVIVVCAGKALRPMYAKSVNRSQSSPLSLVRSLRVCVSVCLHARTSTCTLHVLFAYVLALQCVLVRTVLRYGSIDKRARNSTPSPSALHVHAIAQHTALHALSAHANTQSAVRSAGVCIPASMYLEYPTYTLTYSRAHTHKHRHARAHELTTTPTTRYRAQSQFSTSSALIAQRRVLVRFSRALAFHIDGRVVFTFACADLNRLHMLHVVVLQ